MNEFRCVSNLLINETTLKTVFIRNIPPHGETAPSGPEPPHYRGFTITLRHTTFGRTPLGG